MTDTATDTDYRQTLTLRAAPQAVLAALSTLPGLAGWWGEPSGSAVAGGELRFAFHPGHEPVLRVVTAGPGRVVWNVVGMPALPDWVGTTISFDVVGTGAGSELAFRHQGLTPRLECFSDCRNGWDHYLESLRRYVETGTGMPFAGLGG